MLTTHGKFCNENVLRLEDVGENLINIVSISLHSNVKTTEVNDIASYFETVYQLTEMRHLYCINL